MNKKAKVLGGLGALVLSYFLGTQRPQPVQNIESTVGPAEQVETETNSGRFFSHFLAPAYDGAHIYFYGSSDYGIGKVFAEFDGKRMELKPRIYNESSTMNGGASFVSRSLFIVPDELYKSPRFTISPFDKYGNPLQSQTVTWEYLTRGPFIDFGKPVLSAMR